MTTGNSKYKKIQQKRIALRQLQVYPIGFG